MGKQITRRQHYVWKHHLGAWETGGTIAVLRKGSSGYRTNPLNAAVEKDFYRLPQLNSVDFEFFDKFIASLAISALGKEVAKGWLRPSLQAANARELLSRRGALTSEAELEISEFEIQADEEYQSVIEGNSLDLLHELREGRVDFWENDEDLAMGFSYFIALQHLRTKRMAEVLASGFSEGEDRDSLTRRWPILRHILATNIGSSLFMERANWKLQVLEAPRGVDFITADQPVMNLLSAATRNDMALYFPLSPQRALLMEHEANPSLASGGSAASNDLVAMLNRRIFDYAHEQVFGRDLDHLHRMELG